MGKRKSKAKPSPRKRMNKLDTIFTCPFFNHGSSLEFKMNHMVRFRKSFNPPQKPGTTATKCSTCGGQGQVVHYAQTPLGVFQQVMTCSACGGVGEISNPCNTCIDNGCVRKLKRISLKVPAGVDSGSRVRVPVMYGPCTTHRFFRF